MRLQLALLTLCVAAAPAGADGSLSMRGVYYKERATRVMQPMLDGMFDAGARGLITGHLLVDAITSASSSSGADNAQAFTEKRYEAGIGYTHTLDLMKVGAETKYSKESDYKSFYVGARTEAELAQKNTTLGIGGGISLDTVSAGAAQGIAVPTLACEPGQARNDCALKTYGLFLSGSQIVSRDAVVGLSYDLAKLDGYQSNPYRQAIAGNQFVPEHHPTERFRQAVAASARYFVARTETTLIGAYRYYRDDWKIHAHTPELRAVQLINDNIDASVGYRFHTQNAAFFYRERYDDVMGICQNGSIAAEDCFVSDDVKLSKFTSHTMEAKLGILGEVFDLGGMWAGARFEGVLEYVVQHNRFGNAIIAHVALTLPFEY
jgi:uncharacterized protein DUF3570